MAQAVVSRWSLTAEARVRSRTNHMRFVLDKVAMREVYFRVIRFPLFVSFHQCPTLIFIYIGDGQHAALNECICGSQSPKQFQ
jgi:hypothetical protein